MNDLIICLVGESGSGKTTMAKMLEAIGFNVIHSYTTRPPRTQDEWGHTFVSFNEALNMMDNQKTIAKGFLYGNWYFATEEQYKGKGTSIYVIDPENVHQIKEACDDQVTTIYLKVSPDVRKKRMLADGRDYESVQERINKDKELFKNANKIADIIVENDGDANFQYHNLLQEIFDIKVELLEERKNEK